MNKDQRPRQRSAGGCDVETAYPVAWAKHDSMASVSETSHDRRLEKVRLSTYSKTCYFETLIQRAWHGICARSRRYVVSVTTDDTSRPPIYAYGRVSLYMTPMSHIDLGRD